MGQFYLNGKPVDKIPDYALKIMSERLSRVVSQHFSEHPDEYRRYMADLERRKAARAQASPDGGDPP